MSLFLVQHGRSLSEEEDPGRGLSRQGIQETRTVAAAALDHNVQVDRIIHSGKKRALQTAEIFMQVLEPGDGIAKGSGLAPLDDVAAFATNVSLAQNVMIVGHLPFMERLVSLLVANAPDQPVVKFQNSGIVCLDSDNDGQSFYICWTLFPELK